jgi:dihydrofolate reductase
MRRVISLMHMSLDGFVADASGDFSWVGTDDPQMFIDTDELMSTVDTAVYGRVTYKGMESYWPTVLTESEPDPHALNHAKWIEAVEKIVFSRTLESAPWNNSRIVRDNLQEEVTALKQKEGGNIMVFASATLTHTLAELGLVDEYRLTITPVLLGKGLRMFTETQPRETLTLQMSKTYKNGVIAAHYVVKR